MQTQTIRTTISLPVDFHSQLRIRALREKKSFSDLIQDLLGLNVVTQDDFLSNSLDFFEKTRKSGKQINGVSYIRKMRDSR